MTGPERLHRVAAKCWLTRCLMILMAWVMCWEMHLSYIFITLPPGVPCLLSFQFSTEVVNIDHLKIHPQSSKRGIRSSNHSRRCSLMTDSLKKCLFFWGCESLNRWVWKPQLHPSNRNSINYVPCIWPTPRHLRLSVARGDRISSSPARRPPSPRGRASARLVEEGKMLTAKMKAVTTSTRWADFPCHLVQNKCQIGIWKVKWWVVVLDLSPPRNRVFWFAYARGQLAGWVSTFLEAPFSRVQADWPFRWRGGSSSLQQVSCLSCISQPCNLEKEETFADQWQGKFSVGKTSSTSGENDLWKEARS